MKRVLWIFGVTLVLGSTLVSAHEVPGHLVVNGDITATVETPDGEQTLTGRMNAYFILRGGSMDDGVRVEALNVAFFGVDQRALTGREVRGKPTGVVGFSTTAEGDDRQRLQFDPRRRALVGSVSGRLDMPQIYEMTELRMNPEDDLIELPTIPAKLSVQIDVSELGEISESREKPVETRLRAEMSLGVEPTGDVEVRAFDLRARGRYLEAQLVWWPWIEVGRRLCIQPVRILSFTGGFPFPFFSASGDGLAFGKPGNDAQWAKADVVFTYRDWITLFQPQFSTFSSDEAGALLAQVNVDDCIEVFFVDRFSPQALFGGGATFGLGLASSKVISSDENADFGVDLTHLAHELGHVLGLPHPTAANIASTNTLMCPSGFNNDNPPRNSQENKNNLSNPLLQFSIKILSPGPDCNNSADCGACP